MILRTSLLCAVLAVSSQLCWSQSVGAPSAPRAALLDKTAPKRPAAKSQSEVAAKGAFHTVAAGLPAVKTALEATDITGATKLVGKIGAFVGIVTKVYSPSSHAMVILDFAPHYSDALTAVVKASNYSRFPNLDTLEGKHILVTGTFVAFKKSAEIELTDPSQIKIIASPKMPNTAK